MTFRERARQTFRASAACCVLLGVLATLAAAPVAAQDTAELERLAEESFAADDLPTAVTLYRQLAARLTEKPARLRVLMTIAWLEHLRARDAEALRTLTEVLVIEPAYEFRPELYSDAFRDLFYEAQQRAVDESAARASSSTREGIDALRQGRYAEARQRFDEALKIRPNHPNALYNLALTDLYDQREDEALAGFERLLALRGDAASEISPTLKARALTNVGYLFNRRRQYREAEQALAEAAAIEAGDAATWANLGLARRGLGDASGAAAAFAKAYELSPDDPEVIDNLALAYIDAGDWARAEPLLVEATRRHPENAALWHKLGLAQLGGGSGGAAVSSFETAIARDPGDAAGVASAAAVRLAIYHYGRGEHQRAAAQAERAVAWRPELIVAWVYLGLAQKGAGNLDAARQSLERALSLDPTQAETHNNLGSVYFELGRLADAKASFERALSIAPELADARRNLEAVAQVEGRPRGQTPPPSDLPPALGPRLGVRFADVDYAALGLKGAMVESVEPGSAAERAGLATGDLILKVDGRDVLSAEAFRSYVAGRGKGTSITVDLLRQNLPQRLEIRLY